MDKVKAGWTCHTSVQLSEITTTELPLFVLVVDQQEFTKPNKVRNLQRDYDKPYNKYIFSYCFSSVNTELNNQTPGAGVLPRDLKAQTLLGPLDFLLFLMLS